MMGERSRAVFIWIGVLLIAAGAALFAWFAISDSRASSWPSVQGQVLESSIETSRSSRRNEYSPKARYTYEVAGRPYENNDIWLGESKSFRDYGKASEIVREYRTGGPVTVFYDPADPSRSRLRASGLPWYFLVIIFSGAVFIGVALFMGRGPRSVLRTA